MNPLICFPPNLRPAHFLAMLLFSWLSHPPCHAQQAARISKVLPQYLDQAGRHTLSPSLFERDAYQAYLRDHPTEQLTQRFMVHWKAYRTGRTFTLRAEVRGANHYQAEPLVHEVTATAGRWFARWTEIRLPPEEFHKMGQVVAWRVSLVDSEGRTVAEAASFLWNTKLPSAIKDRQPNPDDEKS